MRSVRARTISVFLSPLFPHLGNLEERFCDIDYSTHLLDVFDSVLDSLGVVKTGGVQDSLNLIVLGLRPLGVHGTAELDQSTPYAEKAEGDDGFLVDDIVFAADSVDGEAGSGGENGGLGDERVAG